jgi:ATP-dependent DNA ligase
MSFEFDLIRRHRHNDRAFLYAFDLIELNGDDLRRDPLEVRKATLLKHFQARMPYGVFVPDEPENAA